MVEFELKINPRQGTAYIPKEIREALGTELKAVPNRAAVLLYPKSIAVKDVVRSITVIKEDLEHALELKEKEGSTTRANSRSNGNPINLEVEK